MPVTGVVVVCRLGLQVPRNPGLRGELDGTGRAIEVQPCEAGVELQVVPGRDVEGLGDPGPFPQIPESGPARNAVVDDEEATAAGAPRSRGGPALRRSQRERPEFLFRDVVQPRCDPLGVTEGSLGIVTGHRNGVAVVTGYPCEVESPVLGPDALELGGSKVQSVDDVSVPPGSPEEMLRGHTLGLAQLTPNRAVHGVVGSSANRAERRFAPRSLVQKKPASLKKI